MVGSLNLVFGKNEWRSEMNVWRTTPIAHGDEGLCGKYDPTCAERTEHALSWCSERLYERFLEKEDDCRQSVDPDGCEKRLLEQFRRELLACAGC